MLPSVNGGCADEELVDGSSVEDELGPDLLSLLQNGIAMERQREGLKLLVLVCVEVSAGME